MSTSIAVLSDTHLGDGSSRLVNGQGQFDSELPAYRKLKDGISAFTGGKPLKYLVLCGDIMDFAINSIDQAISIARPFFKRLAADQLTENIVYVPGNHDKQVWDGLQWDTSVIGNLSEYRNPCPFARTQNAKINAAGEISLSGVSGEKAGELGNMFLKGLFERRDDNPRIILAYPNLYVERNGATVVMTHGHMFETAWVLLSDLLQGVAGIPDKPDLKQLEEWNVPLTAMICTGVGSGGSVSKLFYQIQREVYEKKTGTLSTVLDKVLPRLKNEFDVSCWIRALLPDWVLKKAILSEASKAESPRKSGGYFDDPLKASHFEAFMRAADKEIQALGLPASKTILFGHTHSPYGSKNPYVSKRFPEKTFYNTGGWLKESEAAVFLMDESRLESFAA